MARTMKTVTPPKAAPATLVIHVDPLQVARGHRVLPRGGTHATARRPSRAQAKRQLRRQLKHDTGGRHRP
jgi:hypothetical protein